MKYTVEKISGNKVRITSIPKLDSHVKEYFYHVLVPIVEKNMDISLFYYNTHVVPKDSIYIGSDEDTTVTISDVFVEKHALEKIIKALYRHEEKLLSFKLGNRIDLIQKKIINKIHDARLEIICWDDVKTVDKLANSTDSVFTGNIGDVWWGEPLERFLDTTINSEFFKGDKIYKPNTMKELLRFVIEYYEDNVEHISVYNRYSNPLGVIPKNILIALIQQLVLIEANSHEKHDSIKTKQMKHERIDRALCKIHVDFQIEPDMINHILKRYELLKYSNTKKVIIRSSDEFVKRDVVWVNKLTKKENKKHDKTMNRCKDIEKELEKERNIVKMQFLKSIYGVKADMKDQTQDNMFRTNLDKYNSNQFTRLKLINMDKFNNLSNMFINNVKKVS